MKYALYDHDGILMLASKTQVWDWLKAERRWQDKVRQWLRAEGVSGLVLAQRRRGQPEAPKVWNRASRRAFQRQFKRII